MILRIGCDLQLLLELLQLSQVPVFLTLLPGQCVVAGLLLELRVT